jgi:hypothetical protein
MATQQMLIVCDDRYVLVPQHARPWAPLPGRDARPRQPANLLISR